MSGLIQWQNILPKIDIGADYVYSKGTGETEMQAVGATPFPDIKTQLNSLKLYAQYNHTPVWHSGYATGMKRSTLMTGHLMVSTRFPGLPEQPAHGRRQSEL